MTTRADRALQVTRDGTLALVPITPAALGPRDVLVRVLASSATLSDSVVRRGMSPYLGHLSPPFILGYDFAGRIEQAGSEVVDLEVGQLVVDVVRFGANSDLVVRPAHALTKLPASVDPVFVEPLAMSGMTALQMLTRVAHLEAGEEVLVVGASGSVGLLAVALARILGAGRVYGTASVEKHDLVEAHGGVPIDRDVDLAETLARLSPGGVDVIIDSVGGEGVSRLGQLLSRRGRLVTFGLSGLARGGLLKTPALVERVGRAFGAAREGLAKLNGDVPPRGFDYDITTSRETHRAWYDADLEFLIGQAACGALRQVIEPRPLSRAVEAHADIDAGRVRGRIVFAHEEGSS